MNPSVLIKNALVVNEGLIESDEGLDFDDVLSLACGDEVFWDWMPGPVE